MRRSTSTDATGSRWGYAVAGLFALGFAATIQFGFGELNDETRQSLPPFLGQAYGAAGKLALTVPLAALGGILILRDLLRGARRKPLPVAEELEMAEPIDDAPPPPPGPKTIPGGFGKAKPRGAPAQWSGNPGAGQMALSSTKYLNGGPGNFRKGGTKHTTTDGMGGDCG